MKSKTNFLICGDICPTDDTRAYFEKNEVNSLLNNALPIFQKADVSIANMEFVLTNNPKPAIKTGPILHSKTASINWFKKLNFTALGLANNHIKDCGTEGVLSSLQTCKENNIITVGAGKNALEAKKPIILTKNGWKIGVMAFAEHEFNAAYKKEPGANLLDVYTDLDAIKLFKKEVDYLVILYHGGIEYHAYPSPLLQKKCRKFVECGADFVTCQHSHLIGTEEEYLDGKILYGQGNSIFGYRPKSTTWNHGLLVDITFSDEITVNYIPIETIENGTIKLCNNSTKKRIFQDLKQRKENIKKDGFIEKEWYQFCENKKGNYLPHLFGLGRIANKLNRMLNNWLIKFFYSSKKLMITNNLTRCESHHEVIQTILNKK